MLRFGATEPGRQGAGCAESIVNVFSSRRWAPELGAARDTERGMSVALRVAAAKGGAPAPLHPTVVVPAGPDGRAPSSIALHVALDGSEGSVPVPPGARPGDRLRVVVPTAYPNWGPAPRCAPAPLSASAPAHASVLPTPRLIVREPALLTGAARAVQRVLGRLGGQVRGRRPRPRSGHVDVGARPAARLQRPQLHTAAGPDRRRRAAAQRGQRALPTAGP